MRLIEEFDFNKFIDDYVDLIDNSQWKELYDILWAHRKTDVADFTSMMIEEGADIPLDICKVLFGIKKHDSTLSLRGTIDGGKTYGANFTANQGMKGGHMITFRCISDAKTFRDKLLDTNCYIYTLNPKTVIDYDWVLINTKYGPCYVSTLAKNSFQLINRVIHPWSQLESDIRKKKKEIEIINDKISDRGVSWQDYKKAKNVIGDLEDRINVTKFVQQKFPDLVKVHPTSYWGTVHTYMLGKEGYIFGELYKNRWDALIKELGYTEQSFDEQSPYSKAEIVEAVREYIETILNSNKFPEISSAKVTSYQKGPALFEVGYQIDTTPTMEELYWREVDKLVSPEDQQKRIDNLTSDRTKLENEIQDLKQQVKDLKKQGTP